MNGKVKMRHVYLFDYRIVCFGMRHPFTGKKVSKDRPISTSPMAPELYLDEIVPIWDVTNVTRPKDDYRSMLFKSELIILIKLMQHRLGEICVWSWRWIA